MKHLNVITLALLGCLFAGSAPASEQIGSAVSNLNQRYETLIQVPNPDPTSGGDLQIHCLSLVFQNWSRAYLEILDRTSIDPATVGAPLRTFGRIWFSADDDLKVAEFMRPGVIKVLRDSIEEVRARNGGPAPLDPSKFTLADVRDKDYYANLNICMDDAIIDLSLPRLQETDLTRPIPPGLRRSKNGTVQWVKSANNGIRPEWIEPQSILNNAAFFGDDESITYQEYLQQLQRR